MKKVTIRLDDEQLKKLELVKEETGISDTSSVLRYLLDKHNVQTIEEMAKNMSPGTGLTEEITITKEAMEKLEQVCKVTELPKNEAASKMIRESKIYYSPDSEATEKLKRTLEVLAHLKRINEQHSGTSEAMKIRLIILIEYIDKQMNRIEGVIERDSQ